MSAYPDGFPPDCPLATATPCNCEVFRACKTSPPSDADFMTYAELGFRPNAQGDAACKRYGLSVFPSRKDCEHAMGLFPSLGSHVAQGRLGPEAGQIADTKGGMPNHQTWWPYEDVQRAALFS